VAHGIQLCILCGKEPTMQFVEEKLVKEGFSGKPVQLLQSYTTLLPRDITPSVTIDPGIIS
jgi:hypothetical protein